MMLPKRLFLSETSNDSCKGNKVQERRGGVASPVSLLFEMHCARGDMENRIKEQQKWLFADRTSCHYFRANRFRLLLSSAAYVLLETIRQTAYGH